MLRFNSLAEGVKDGRFLFTLKEILFPISFAEQKRIKVAFIAET